MYNDNKILARVRRMKGLKAIFNRYNRYCETRDDHSEEGLRTHYYKADSRAVFNTLEGFFSEADNLVIKSSSDERGELLVESTNSPACILIVTVISLQPFETAVDMTASADRNSLTGVYPDLRLLIMETYKALNGSHTYIIPGKGNVAGNY